MHFYILRGRAERSKKHSRCKRAGGAERSKNRTLQVPKPVKTTQRTFTTTTSG